MAGALLAIALGLLLPAGALGARQPRLRLDTMRLHASNGYDFVVLGAAPAEGEDGAEEGSIAVYVSRHRHRTFDAVSYGMPATITRTTIDADLGKLGRVSVTRVKTGHEKTVHSRCLPGGKRRVQAERYEGTIEFHGEEGFIDLSASSAPLVPVWVCGTDERASRLGKRLPAVRLDVERHWGENRIEFDATQKRPGARTLVSAEIEEHRGEAEIHRATGILAGASALRYTGDLRTATLKPPGPFAGHGSFRRSARRAQRWTGNLTADFPGHSDVPLAGRGFRADLEYRRG